MSDLPVGKALGLIETRGYTALIAATDSSAKYAHVDVLSVQRASGGLVLIALVGDVASVQAAVDAGSREAQTVGELISAHVIPRPDESVWRMLGLRAADDSTKPEKTQHRAAKKSNASETREDLDALPVRELRRIARSTESIELSGRDISRASKHDLIDAIRRARIT